MLKMVEQASGRRWSWPQMVSQGVCDCAHDRAMHQHFRGGTDCGSCGSGTCSAFRKRTATTSKWRAVLAVTDRRSGGVNLPA